MSQYVNRLVALFHNIQKKNVVARFKQWTACIESPDDGLERLPLTSPEVRELVAPQVAAEAFRLRVAMPKDVSPDEVAKQSFIEVYSNDGMLAQAFSNVRELEGALAQAVEAELLDMLQAPDVLRQSDLSFGDFNLAALVH